MPTTITLAGGEVVVPMSTLLDALSTVLTEAERLTLFGELLSLRPDRVAPGDLITADLFNLMRSDINELMLRVANLEANADTSQIPPVITSILPPTVRAGEEIVVSGQGLAAVNLQSLRFDNTPVSIGSIKPGSSQTRLIINAPGLMGVPVGGKTIILALINGAGMAQGSYTQLPGLADKLQTKISFVQKSLTPAGAIKPNFDYTLTVEATVAASADETFDLLTAIDGAGFSIVSATPASIDVAQGSALTPEKHTFTIKVHTGAAGTGSLTASLKGRHYIDAVGPMVPDIPFTIAATPELPSDKVVFGQPKVDGPHGFSAAGKIQIFRPKANQPAKLTLPVTLVEGGEMKVPNLKVEAANQWTASIIGGLGVALTPNVGASLTLNVQPKLGADGQPLSTTGTLSFDVTNASGTQKRPFKADIEVIG